MQPQSPTITATRPNARPQAAVRAAWWLYWLTIIALLIGSIVGAGWDRLYHALVPFDSFWSPPHLFVYTSGGIAALLVMALIYSRPLRLAFNHRIDIKLLPFPVGGGVVLLGAGLVLLGFGGAVLDNYWHTQFGLNETSWSFPHSMIGWSLVLITLGAASARLSLARPTRWYTHLFLVYVVFAVSLGVVLGPLSDGRTLQSLELVYQFPGLQTPEAQHTYRIYAAFNLTRTNPLLLLLTPLWLGAALSFAAKLDRRWWVILLPITLVVLGDNAEDSVAFFQQFYDVALLPAAGRALPLFLPTVLWLLLRWRRVPPRWAWGIVGLVLGVLLHSAYGMPAYGWLLLPAAIGMIYVGAWAGARIGTIVLEPTSLRRIRPLLLLPVLIPLGTGIVDLYLRFTVP